MWLLDQAAPLNGVLAAHVAGALDEAAVRAGLARIQRRHPLLRAAVAGEPRPRFVDGEAEAPLRVVRGDWRAVAEEELNRRFDPDGRPLLRAAIVAGERGHTLLLCHHHLVSDALSAVQQALEVLAPTEAAPLAVRPPMQELLPPSQRGLGRLARLNAFFWRQAARAFDPGHKLRYDARPPLAERRTRFLPHVLDAAATDALAARCRAEATTVHGALAAAILVAARAEMPDKRAPTIGCFSTIDVRGRLSPTVARDEVGLFVSQATTYHRPGDGADPWPLAREVKRALDRRIAAGEPMITLPLLGLFVPRGVRPVEKLARRVDLAAPAAVGVTNLGRVAGGGALTGMHFAIGLAPVAPAAIAAATVGGALHWSLVYVEPLLSPARAGAMAARVGALLGQPTR